MNRHVGKVFWISLISSSANIENFAEAIPIRLKVPFLLRGKSFNILPSCRGLRNYSSLSNRHGHMPSIRNRVLCSGMLLYLHHINFKIFFHPAKFDNFKDETISDYKTV